MINFDIKLLQTTTILSILQAVTVYGQCNSSFIGYALVGHVYKNVSSPSPVGCYSVCRKDEPLCRSFNFHANRELCELSTRSKDSRPQDLQVSNLSIYFHSCYRERFGSKPSMAANSCSEIYHHDDSKGNGRYWLKTDDENNTAAEIYCNMANAGDMTSSFDLIFPPVRNISNYVMIDSLSETLSELTVSLWLKTNERILVPISYAVGNQMNAILIYIDETGLLRFLVAEQQIEGFSPLDDNRWHHVCATWESTTGHAQVFIDGNLQITGVGVNTGGQIQGGGKLVLGLDQDSLGGGFDIQQSFVGELTHVYLWNTALTLDVISNMASECMEFPHPGHVVGWADFGGKLNGEVALRNYSRCHYDPVLII